MGKIIIATALFPPEPVVSASLSYDIAHELAKKGKDVVVISPKPSRPLNYAFPKISHDYKFEHVILETYIYPASKIWGRFKESYSFGNAIKKYIKHNHELIDVIYANVWPLFSQFLLAKAAKKYKIPYCIHIQDIYPESYSEKVPSFIGRLIKAIFMPMDKFVLQNAAKVIAISPSSAHYLVKTRGLDTNNIEVVRNWQNDDTFEKKFRNISSIPHKKRFMYLGSINPTADVEFLIRAFSKFDSNDYKLSIIGNGPNCENCKELSKSLNMCVEFDVVTPDQVPEKQAEADVLILSLKEGVARTATPSKLTAYLYSGRPVIACVDIDSDCANIIRSAQCGFVVAPNDCEELRKIIEMLIGMSLDRMNIMGYAGLELARKELSKKENLNKLLNIIISNDRNTLCKFS